MASDFYTLLDEYIGDADAIDDIRVTVRRCWFYDFNGHPIRLWQGKGKLFTTDGNQWLGSIDASNNDHHRVPPIQDGRDGSSATYNVTLVIPDLPGEPAFQLYNQLKEEQWRVTGRSAICYLTLFQEGEALRPTTPIVFFKELTMMTPKFSEAIVRDSSGTIVKRYSVTVPMKDGNLGRSNVPNGTYADTIQKQRAKELGVALDRGSEFLALLSNRTYQIP